MVYQPSEDSVLLARAINKYARGRVLDMGTGTGYLASAASTKEEVTSVLGVDVDSDSIALCKRAIKLPKVSFLQSNLFENVSGEFDTIVFNPPYLPNDQEFHDIALHGGKRGYETIITFLEQVSDYLAINGKILLLFSSHSRKDKIDEFLERGLFDYKEISSEGMGFFEDLYVYQIKKNILRKEIEKKGVSKLNYFAKGRRGFIFKGTYNGMIVALKIRNKESKAIGRLENEAKWLDELRETGMCPKLLFSSEHYLCYEFVEGEFLPEFLGREKKEYCLEVLHTILGYCRLLDRLGVNKEEMTRPIKHVLISIGTGKRSWTLKKESTVTVTMIDFERCAYKKSPNNVSQFVQYLNKDVVKEMLKGKVKISSKILEASRDYKKSMDDEGFEKVKGCVNLV